MTELVNLLPPERKAALMREYFVRLATVAVLAFSAVALGSGALLVPSYLYLSHEIGSRQAQLRDLDAQLAAAHGKETTAELAQLTQTAAYLARLATSTPATAAFRGVLSVPRTGIAISGLSYSQSVKGNDGRMTLTGTAATREALRAYNDALSALPYVSNVDLPISAYAKETAIPFTITLTGSLSP